tara:strand:+ start:682 stop:1665 length:984 start_codon:yes stop_codon:yes gene_type:complete
MQSSNELLFIAGLGSTGSSAICDVLRSFEGVVCPEEEWRIWTDPDGLLDLVENISLGSTMFQHSLAIKRFSEMINNLTNSKIGSYSTLKLSPWIKLAYREFHSYLLSEIKVHEYRGTWYGETNKILAKLNFHPYRFLWKKSFINRKMYVLENILDSRLLIKIGEKLKTIIYSHAGIQNNECIAINENFSILRAEAIFNLHPNSKMILVIRDPLDVYADSLKVGWLAMPYDINQFIVWQNQMHSQIEDLHKRFRDKIHILKFEDLCTEFENELKRIHTFLPGILKKRKDQLFFPEVSKKNIGQWKEKNSWIEAYRKEFLYHSKSLSFK